MQGGYRHTRRYRCSKGGKIIGTPLKERLPGIEIGEAILEYAAGSGKSVFLLGAKPGVAETAAAK